MRDTIPGEDKEELIAQAGKQEIPLTLTNKFESIADDDESDMKPLFVRYEAFSESCKQRGKKHQFLLAHALNMYFP